MRFCPPWLRFIGAGAVIAAIVPALAQSAGKSVSADEIIRTLVGKTCTTKAGAKFTFTHDGHYAYAGAMGEPRPLRSECRQCHGLAR